MHPLDHKAERDLCATLSQMHKGFSLVRAELFSVRYWHLTNNPTALAFVRYWAPRKRDFRSADAQGSTKLSAITVTTKKPATARTNAIFSISRM